MLEEIATRQSPIGEAVRALLERHGSREGVIRARKRRFANEPDTGGVYIGNTVPDYGARR